MDRNHRFENCYIVVLNNISFVISYSIIFVVCIVHDYGKRKLINFLIYNINFAEWELHYLVILGG